MINNVSHQLETWRKAVLLFVITLTPCECSRLIQPTRRGQLLWASHILFSDMLLMGNSQFSIKRTMWWDRDCCESVCHRTHALECRAVKSSHLPAKITAYLLVSAGYSSCHFFTDGINFLNKISLDWPLTLTTQLFTSKLSDNPVNGSFYDLLVTEHRCIH